MARWTSAEWGGIDPSSQGDCKLAVLATLCCNTRGQCSPINNDISNRYGAHRTLHQRELIFFHYSLTVERNSSEAIEARQR